MPGDLGIFEEEGGLPLELVELSVRARRVDRATAELTLEVPACSLAVVVVSFLELAAFRVELNPAVPDDLLLDVSVLAAEVFDFFAVAFFVAGIRQLLIPSCSAVGSSRREFEERKKKKLKRERAARASSSQKKTRIKKVKEDTCYYCESTFN